VTSSVYETKRIGPSTAPRGTRKVTGIGPYTIDTEGLGPISQVGHEPIQYRLLSADTPIKDTINNEDWPSLCQNPNLNPTELEMWANAQRDGRPAEYRWRPLFNAAVWLTPTSRVPCSNAAKTRNPLKFGWVPKTNESISAASGSKFTIM